MTQIGCRKGFDSMNEQVVTETKFDSLLIIYASNRW